MADLRLSDGLTVERGARVPAVQRSPEFRAGAAGLIAAIALALAVLEILDRHTDLLMLDFRLWRPAARESPAAVEAFDSLQRALPPEQRPFRLILGVGVPGAERGMAAVRVFAVTASERYCLRVLATASSVTGDLAWPSVEVVVDGLTRRRIPMIGLQPGGAITVDGMRPRGDRLEVRLATRAAPAPAAPPPSALVHFEYAVLRACGHGGPS
jgi:hypothetical protein